MKQLFQAVLAVSLALSSFNHAFAYEYEEKTGYWFPLNRSLTADSFSGGGLAIQSTCTVNKNPESPLYEYTIVLNYETDKNKLLTWNFLDWVLSAYQNAKNGAYPDYHLFPLHKGAGNYTFHFKTTEAPVWFQHTLIKIFPNDELDVERKEYVKEKAELWSGVTVSSYDYIAAELGVGFSSCLPYDLLVFPRNVRSGF